jgi:hypothetical protein
VIDWDDEPGLPPIEELHAEAQAISRIVELREARVGIEYDLWWIEREMQLAVASLRQE